MKSKLMYLLCATTFAFSISACSSESKKAEETQVPEMSSTMPAEIATETPAPAVEEQPKAKKSAKSKKKSAKKKSQTSS